MTNREKVELRLEIESMLKDYLRKLERDDYDPNAISKMKAVNKALKRLEACVIED